MPQPHLILQSVTVEAAIAPPVGALLAAPAENRLNYPAPRRRHVRLLGFEYSSEGAYFVTICTANREGLFGDVVDGKMRLNEAGRIVHVVWDGLSKRFPSIELDAVLVTPNHVHGIFGVGAGLAPPKMCEVGAALALPLRGAASSAPTKSVPLAKVVRAFKSIAAIGVNNLLVRSGQPLWQRNYFEHVIRDEEALNRIRDSIATNPLRWDLDKENPARRGEDEFDRWLATSKSRPVKSKYP